MLNMEAALFFSFPLGVVAVGFKDSFHRFLYPFLEYIAERWYFVWYFLKKGVVIETFSR